GRGGERCLRVDGDVGPDEPDAEVPVLRLERLGHPHVVREGRRTRVEHRELVVAGEGAHGLTLEAVRPLARDYELAVLHTSTPSFPYDVRMAEALKAENRHLRVGFVGAHVAVHPEASLAASPAIDFVARGEFDFTIQEVVQGRPLGRILGLSYREDGGLRRTPDRPTLENMDAL